MLTPITVREIMQTPVETVGPSVSVREAATILADRQIGTLVVCEDDDPVGIITDVDVTRLVSDGQDVETTTVGTIMSSPLITVEADASIETAAATLREHLVKRLPVVEDGEVVGIVTTTDLSNYVPHLARLKREADTGPDHPKLGRRADTAYERDEWDYEYFGDEGAIDTGDRLTFSKPLDDADVRAFADASGDTNRLHLDESFAAETRFGERIAHGTLVAGLISAALARLPGLTIYLSQDLSFLGPVSLGDEVTAECRVVERLGENRFRLTTSVINGDGEKVIDGEAVVISDALPE
jgi:acyl dehydratase/CBS domain-containing protein